ncbi:MAG: substrate-binding domain-containing protein, partial [Eggerthellaceae bacterium]|nr:substrate-binding domain-containing protein [Eggerthellaceae bacterium]
MSDEKNAGEFIEENGKIGGPEESMAREKEMDKEVARNDPEFYKTGPGLNMAPEEDIATTYAQYQRDETNPARPIDGTEPTVAEVKEDEPDSQATWAQASDAAAEAVEKMDEGVATVESEYDMASTISSIEDAEQTFHAFDRSKMMGAQFTRNIIFAGSSAMAPLVQALVDGFKAKYHMWSEAHPSLPMAEIDITVTPTDTNAGIQAVIDHEADFAMASCPVPYSTYEKFGEFKEAFDLAREIVAIGVNQANELSEDTLGGLSRMDYASIFSGHVTRWSDVDPALPAEPIKLHVSKSGSGIAEVFNEVIMQGEPVSADAKEASAARDLAPALTEDPWGIGYAPLQDILAINHDALKILTLKVDGNEPNEVNVDADRYPLVLPLTFMTSRRADPFIHALLT